MSVSPAEPPATESGSRRALRDVDAVVLVGGKGTRLRPLTLSAPKPMLPTAGVPFLTHLLCRIRAAGVTRVVLGTSYKAEVFERHFGDGSALGLDLRYVVEDRPLDTAGAIRNAADGLSARDVMVFNGDILSGVDPAAVVDTHRASGAHATLHLVRVKDPRRFGSVPTDETGRVLAFLEKTDDPPTDQINAGCYVFRREVVDEIPAGRPVSVERETFPGLLESGARLQGHVDTSYWLDLGTPAAFVRGSADLVRGVVHSPALPRPAGPAIVLAGARVADDAKVHGGTAVGEEAEVGSGATVEGSVLFSGAVVGKGAEVRRCVVGARAVIGAGAVVEDSVIGDDAVIGENCELVGGARVWPGVELPSNGIRFSADV
ncbi:sugar phosphate nucleotidyltransferase [Actinoalloteichus spitiensis]|uniref:sugar phosphate nucleotidyltransferase n=1 Tax=Actinoalloteichus spitiensis TaxID=252394 RepID=UPI00036B2968|nr:NDP-sugar synthase [Actinoalloteichus spitiensis]